MTWFGMLGWVMMNSVSDILQELMPKIRLSFEVYDARVARQKVAKTTFNDKQ